MVIESKQGMKLPDTDKIAIWVVTPHGLVLAEKILKAMPTAELFVSRKLNASLPATSFGRMTAAVSQNFAAFSRHIFITAAGIAVRMIAPHLRHKTLDPAVVVLDDQGRHAISLVSGHIGGANALAEQIAGLLGARPVITTATDVSGVPAIDTIAVGKDLFIENPAAIKTVNMAFIRREKICLFDPADILAGSLAENLLQQVDLRAGHWPVPADHPGVYVSDTLSVIPETVLVLRPKSLAVGIGCNRNTDSNEIRTLLLETLKEHCLSADSLKTIASIDIKNDEPGLLALSADLEIPLVFYPKEELNTAMGIENPSAMVETHTGAKSVCEAAAILATDQGSLIVPKKKSKNATVAIARAASM